MKLLIRNSEQILVDQSDLKSENNRQGLFTSKIDSIFALTKSWKCCSCRSENYNDKWTCSWCRHNRCNNCKQLEG